MATSKMTSRKTYSKYYGNFRGVDFSSDHTNVADSRFAYAVNMYRDYQSGQGVAIETIPGFRKLDFPKEFVIPEEYKGNRALFDEENIYGLHKFNFVAGGIAKKVAFLHKGTRLYIYDFDRKLSNYEVTVSPGNYLFENGESVSSEIMSESQSISFMANNILYILDGTNIVVVEYAPERSWFMYGYIKETAFVPTIYERLKPNMTVKEIKEQEVNQINLLSKDVKFTFVADGKTTRFDFPIESALNSPIFVKVYGEEVTVFKNAGETYVEFETAPSSPQEKGFEEGYAGIEISIEVNAGLTINGKHYTSELITGCTLFAEFDNRIFLSGNPICPNHVFWCGFNNGYADPTYWGILNYSVDGVGYSPITGMMTVADALLVLKADTEQDGAIYYHQPKSSNIPIAPTIYPSVQGLNGTGCLGACINFLDDPVFVSKNGLEGIRTLSLMYERNIEHRSSLIDVKLEYLSRYCKLAEWGGYLWFLCAGRVFLADSRQKYTDSNGVTQYEWYMIEGIGMYDNQYHDYKFANVLPPFLEDVEVYADRFNASGENRKLTVASNLYDEIYESYYDARGMSVNEMKHGVAIPQENIYKATTEKGETVYFTDFGTSKDSAHYYLLEEQPYFINGGFYGADNIYVLTGNVKDGVYFSAYGRLFKFNFDMRREDGSFPREAYSFDDRIIRCGVATKMDNCGILGYTKNTVKKSTVIKTKSLVSSAAKVKVRTNKDPYKQIDRISSGFLDFNNVDFSDFTFAPEGDTLFTVREKEKKWVEKQYYIYSDEYEKPFSLYYIGYDYNVAGRYKEGK